MNQHSHLNLSRNVRLSVLYDLDFNIMLIAKHIQTSITEVFPQQNEALIAALKLVMLNNIFAFGDMTFKQMNVTAMGTPQHRPTRLYTMGCTNQNSSQNTRTMSSSTNALSTTSLESGYLTQTLKSIHNSGTNSLPP